MAYFFARNGAVIGMRGRRALKRGFVRNCGKHRAKAVSGHFVLSVRMDLPSREFGS
jgi:hypothetical protein